MHQILKLLFAEKTQATFVRAFFFLECHSKNFLIKSSTFCFSLIHLKDLQK